MSADGPRKGPGDGVRLLAPAKLNLGLRVHERRPDGYHDIESLFVPIDLADEVRLELRPGGRGRVELELVGAPAGVPGDASNLAARAAAGFLREAGLDLGVRLRLRKRIPAGAGLGGGSSDAGSVLRGLATRLPGALARERLAALALSLGADVPFFLDPRPARVTGVGEHIEPVTGLPALAFLLACPFPPLATAEVYELFDAERRALTPGKAGRTLEGFSELRDEGGRIRAGTLARLLTNDLEPAARRLHPAIGQLKAQIRSGGALAAGMSGSGPTVFGVFEDRAAARAARRQLAAKRGVWVRVAAALGAAEGESG